MRPMIYFDRKSKVNLLTDCNDLYKGTVSVPVEDLKRTQGKILGENDVGEIIGIPYHEITNAGFDPAKCVNIIASYTDESGDIRSIRLTCSEYTQLRVLNKKSNMFEWKPIKDVEDFDKVQTLYGFWNVTTLGESYTNCCEIIQPIPDAVVYVDGFLVRL